MHGTNILITGPTSEPITVAEVKEQGRIDIATDDAYLSDVIVGARRDMEQHSNRALLTQTWEAIYDCFPVFFSLIPCPLQSVTSIKYLDDMEVEQTLPAADYRVDSDSEPARITPAFGKTWPSTRGVINSVRVRFVAGFTSSAAVPQAIKHKLKILCVDRYDRRGSVEFSEGLSPGELFFGDRVWI